MEEQRAHLISLLSTTQLKLALSAAGLTGVDRRSPRAMREALAHGVAVTAQDLARMLGESGQTEARRVRPAPSGPPAPARATERGKKDKGPAAHLAGPFVAIDFETADTGRDSACAVALVRVEGDQIVERCTRLIRPPRRQFEFTYIHGIRWNDVAREPTFGPVWAGLQHLIRGATFFAAHNASFDRGVLQACCGAAGLAMPALPFECTVQWARRAWGIRPTNLPAVCEYLHLPLKHHDAGSDAEACARILIAARRAGRA